MRRVLIALATLSLLVGVTPAAVFAAAPVNDNFADAIVLSELSGSISGTTVEATDETNEGSLAAYQNYGVWYRLTNGGRKDLGATVDTCAAASYDTFLAVYAGLGSGPPEWGGTSRELVGANDDAFGDCPGLRSRVSFTASAGQTYWIRVSGFSGGTGSFTLSWWLRPFERGTLVVTLTNSRISSSACTMTVKGSNLLPGGDIEINTVWESADFTALAGRWTDTTQVDAYYWSKQNAGEITLGEPVYAADGFTEVVPKFVNRCSL